MRIVMGLMLALAGLSAGVAQSAPAQTYVTLTAHRLPPDRLDALRALIAAEQPAIEAAKRKGGIVDVHWLIHAWGNEYNAIEVITWSSWAAVGDPSLNVEGAYDVVYKDPAERKRVEAAWASVFQGVHHEDGIYYKVP